MMNVPYKFAECSEFAKGLIVGKVETKNPMGERKRMVPLNKLIVGHSLFFHYGEMIDAKIINARDSMKRYNKTYDNMFVAITHKEPIKMLEIVRIK